MVQPTTGWNRVFYDTEREIAYKLKIFDVKSSFWGMGRSDEEIEREARRRLRDEDGIEYPEPRRAR
ncbi:MAG: hypothetical protein KF832_25095 [Caldilineaceae bacterium]|nr:hypothetical protein [Caldilineaceae bacterium]